MDETLDREVLLMLQGPNPEHMALEFKSLLNKLVTKCEALTCTCTKIPRRDSSGQLASVKPSPCSV